MKAITTHKNPDFDAIASCVAAKKLYPDAVIIFPKIQQKAKVNFMIQSLIYPFLDKTSEIDIEKIDTLIVVDTHSSKRIESKFKKTLSKAKIICYDHHQEGNLNCAESYLVDYGANTTQLVEKIIEKNIEIDEEEATLFMLGIYADTGRLTYISTTPSDIKAAAYLLEKGADLETIKSILEEALSETDVTILNELVKNKRIFEVGNIKITLSFASVDEYVANVANLVSKLMSIDRSDAAICAFRMGSNVYVIGRSNNDNVDVAKILKEIGGGGHSQAASASIKNATLIQVTERLSQIIKSWLFDQIKAKDIMSFPPKFVYSDEPLKDVNEKFSKSGMNAFVVLDRHSDKVEGIITRQIVNKAIYHHLEEKPIGFFANTEIKVVDEDETFNNIKSIVLDEKQRLIPVVKNGKLVGVITRTNLFKILMENINRETPLKQQNIGGKIRATLPENVLYYLKEAGNAAKELNFNAYLVGGIVRDIILGYENLDIDIVIEGDGIEFAKHFAKKFNAKVATHERFKTATIILPDKTRIDVATAREEYYDLPGSLPVVEKSSIKLDLYRRDFTINALAVKLHDKFGDLLDFFGGLNDIKNKKIRVLHMLSFIDDPTRMYRAVRFAARLGFEIGEQTERLIKSAVELGVVHRVEKVRIFNEIVHILNNENVVESFKMLKKYNLIRALNERLIIDNRILDYLKKTEDIVKSYSIFCKNRKFKRERVFLIVLEYLFRKSASFIESIGADEVTINFVRKVLAQLPKANGVIQRKDSTNLEVYNVLSRMPLEGVLALYVLAKDNRKVVVYLEELMHAQPLICGEDILKLGFKPSKIFSDIIKSVFEQQLLGNIGDKIEAIEFVKKHFVDKTGERSKNHSHAQGKS